MISLAGLPLLDVLAELPLLLVAHVPRALQLVAVIIVVAAFSAASPPASFGLFFLRFLDFDMLMCFDRRFYFISI